MQINTIAMRRVAGAVVLAFAVSACQSGDKNASDSAGADAKGLAAPGQGPGEGDRINQYQGVQLAAMRDFSGDRQAAIAGRQAFLKYNCVGCHGGLAGGAMGPSLRDEEWKFGGTDEQILATLHQGRPAGMPSFKGVATEEELRSLIPYIRSLRTQAEPTFFFTVGDTTTPTAHAYTR